MSHQKSPHDYIKCVHFFCSAVRATIESQQSGAYKSVLFDLKVRK